MPEIIRYEDEVYDGLYHHYIFGLTIFNSNKVDSAEDAMITFLRALVTAYPCAAQIGLLPLEGDDPREVFAPLQEGRDYFLTHVNSYAHGGLWVEPDRPAGCFFPQLTPSFFELTTDDGRMLIDYLLMYDQPALYVNVDSIALSNLTALYAQPPLANELEPEKEEPEDSVDRARAFINRWAAFEHRWWAEATRFVPLGIQGGYDDAIMTVYSRDPSHFHLLDQPLEQTCEIIRATPWFQAHQLELRWQEDEYGFRLSLLLPDFTKEGKAQEAKRQEHLRKREEGT
ncbi:MAG: hypothetical protein ACYDBB_11080 [Armatimonadota bacterium]